MKIGFDAINRGSDISPETITTIVQTGEALGFDLFALSDHIVIPMEIGARYPYSVSGVLPGEARDQWFEQLTTAAYLAAQSESLGILTSVMVMPYRPPMLAAKMLATLDVLSGGRLIVGCGTGWLKEEFIVVGAPSYADRAVVTDEYLQAFRELWTSDDPAFAGTHVAFSGVNFKPKPIQKPHPPLWVGGESTRAQRRAAQFGDGWYPITSNSRHPLDTLPRIAAAVALVRDALDEAERSAASFTFALRCGHLATRGGKAAATERLLLTGGASAIAEDVESLEKIGVEVLVVPFAGASAQETVDEMKRFSSSVLPLLPGR